MKPAGAFRHLATIQSRSETVSIDGIRSETWAAKTVDGLAYANVPVSFRALSARELLAAGARQSESTVEFEFRAGLDIDPQDRILFDGKVYDIEPPELDPTRARFIRIKARRSLTNG